MNESELSLPTESSSRHGHSGMGIASFVLGLLSILCLLAALVVIVSVTAASGGHLDPRSAVAVGSGLIIMLAGLLGLIGTALGVAGVMQRMRQRVFAILGLCFNGPVVLLVIIIFIIGIAKS